MVARCEVGLTMEDTATPMAIVIHTKVRYPFDCEVFRTKCESLNLKLILFPKEGGHVNYTLKESTLVSLGKGYHGLDY